MTFYHGTTQKIWEKIQKEGILFGKRAVNCSQYHPSRCTYLTPVIEEAMCYGDILLQVEYDPYVNPKENNYTEGGWQVRVYEPIPLSKIKLLAII